MCNNASKFGRPQLLISLESIFYFSLLLELPSPLLPSPDQAETFSSMAFAQYLLANSTPLLSPPLLPSTCLFSLPISSSSWKLKRRSLSISPQLLRTTRQVKSKPGEAELSPAVDAFTQFKHLLLPVTDGNPYLSEGTKQAMATTAALAKKYEADITVLVINEKEKESLPEHDTQLASIRWHLSEGGYQDFKLLERLGEGNKPTAIIGEVADDMNLDLVVMSMEAIHSKHVDANLLAEFIPCPVLLLPL
ncbi:uncharacterized protein LOC111370359 isoform X2 [Olea europaea var. sylvestris]|uniref:uncharacterized protein LOC111370359 isoform X2 n=1 Tax=Olea europaea var. sylvestris TaxID=158386 RepID=UPI000C1D5D0F|nr:uncharacterized protein LOC111370359 isoform X2 [Olea europaea var. sylvestris]